MATEIVSVTFEKDAMNYKDGHFTIPTRVCNLMRLGSDDSVWLEVRTPEGSLLFEGRKQLKSGFEIYGSDIEGSIKAGQRIRVTVSRA